MMIASIWHKLVSLKNIVHHQRELSYPKNAPVQRLRILAALKLAGASGLTRDQLTVATGIPIQSVSWRVRELRAETEPLVYETQRPERLTRSGVKAKVLFIG